jgi:Ca-activated chloride channel family protein
VDLARAGEGPVRRALLLILAGLAGAGDTGPLAGRSLAEALRQLEARGLHVIFSSELVRPEMQVASEPKASRPEEVLAEILRPHGLAFRPGPGGRVLVVRAPLAYASPAPDSARRRPAPAFGSEVRVVRLDVSVIGRDGRFVTDRGLDDFEVYEDGVRQTMAIFTRREMPLSLVLLLDASSSMSDRLALAKAAATGFLQTLRPQDQASVIEFNDAATVLQEMTSDQAVLRQAIERVSAKSATALYNSLYATLNALPRSRDQAELRRHAVLLVSDGEDTASLVWEEQVLELARRREAAIHTIDLGTQHLSSRSARLLRVLSSESGGQLHRLASVADLAGVYARIGEELRSQYTVGYQSSAVPDGRWRRIEVRIRGGRDLHVRHRTGYYAEP